MMRVLAFVTLSLCLAGCADRVEPLYRVTGKVTWQGKPLESGQINFVDVAGQSTPASAKIVDGAFEIRTTQGLKTIMVYNQRDLGFNKAMNQHVFTNDVSAKFNARSKLQFEVQPHDNNVYEVGLPQKK